MRRRDSAEATGAIWVDSGATHPGATGLEAPGDSLPPHHCLVALCSRRSVMYLIANICSQNGPPRENSVWQGGRVHL